MKMVNLLILGLFSVTSSQAQHHNFWLRTNLNVPVTGKVSSDIEFQHRRQNGFESKNRLEENLMYTYRNWFHYQHSEDVLFSVSPFAYFSHFKIIEKELDENAGANSEIRFSVAISLTHELFKHFYFFDRSGLEYRVLEITDRNILRFRNRLGLGYRISENIKVQIYDELFLNIGGVGSNHFFDHDRVGINVVYNISKHVKLDVGYLHITRLPLLQEERIREDNIVLNFSYSFVN